MSDLNFSAFLVDLTRSLMCAGGGVDSPQSMESTMCCGCSPMSHHPPLSCHSPPPHHTHHNTQANIQF